MTQTAYRAGLSDDAAAELEEAISYIERDSPQNAAGVTHEILKAVARLRRFPRAGAVDPDAPPMHRDVEARRVAASGFVIRYIFPFKRAGRDTVYVVSIRRASRPPLDDMDFMRRLVQEVAGVYAPSAISG